MRDIRRSSDLRALRLEGNTVGVEAAQTIAKALENKEMLQVNPQVHLQHPEAGRGKSGGGVYGRDKARRGVNDDHI